MYWRCAKRTCLTRITATQDEELLQQTAGHNHPVDAVDCQVQAIRSQMKKRAREEITPVPAMYNEQLISLNTHPERNSIEVQMIQVAAGGQPIPKKRKAVRQDEQIKRLVAEFSNGQRTLDSFLSALANMVVDFS